MRTAPDSFWYGAASINVLLVLFFILSGFPEKAILPIISGALCLIPTAFTL